jgi:hypothetical protein
MVLKNDAYLDDDDEVVRDGESVRVPIFLMDEVQRTVAMDGLRLHDGMGGRVGHKSGYVFSGNVRQRDAAYDEARREARGARAQWLQQLRDSWKRTPGRDAGPEPDAAEVLLKRHLGTGPTEPDADDAQVRRDRQWAEYCDRVSNAWRNPSGLTDPGAALTIERRRQRYTYEASR